MAEPSPRSVSRGLCHSRGDANDWHHATSRSKDGRLTQRRVRAYLGLGANVGDAQRTLTETVSAIEALPGVRLHGVSRLYATAPVGVTDQPEFRNAVVAIDAPAGPDPATGAMALLERLKDLSASSGAANAGAGGPRELDLDLLVFGRARVAVERTAGRAGRPTPAPTRKWRLDGSEVPHPSAAARLFVLAPMADLAPGLVPPGWRRTVETARRAQARLEPADAVRPIGTWDPARRAWVPITATPATR